MKKLLILLIGIIAACAPLKHRDIVITGISSRAVNDRLDSVNIGTSANSGTGDPLRTAFIKTNRAINTLDSLFTEGIRYGYFKGSTSGKTQVRASAAAGSTVVTLPASTGTLATTTQLSSYAPLISPTFEGTVTLPLATSIGTVSSTELGYVDGTTSNIQTQLNSISAGSSASWNIVNVKDHGAIGDGIADDSDSIQARIANNTVLYFPIGTYMLKDYLTIANKSNVKLKGEKGTVILINEETGLTNNYRGINITGNCYNIEVTGIKFRNTVTDADTLSGAAFIMTGCNILDGFDVNNCEFTAPNLDLNAIFMSSTKSSGDIQRNIRIENNLIDSIGRIGFELYETSYVNEADSASFRNVKIKNNAINHAGLRGIWGVAISLAGVDVEVSGNSILEHGANQAIEIGHSYRTIVSNNTVYTNKSTTAFQAYRSHYLVVTDNVFHTNVNEGYNIQINECYDVVFSGNFVKSAHDALYISNSNNGIVSNNLMIAKSNFGVMLAAGTQNYLVTGNKIDLTNTSSTYGAINIHANTGDTWYNVVENNYLTSGQTGGKIKQEYINKSKNRVTEGSGDVKTKLFTIGTPGDTKQDYTFTSVANTTEQVITLIDALPRRCRVIGLEMVNVETLTSSGGAVDITLEAGTSSSGAEFISALSCNNYAEVVGIIDATKPATVRMIWSGESDTYFSNIYITGLPTQNWNTLTEGKWEVYLTYIDLRYK